jgi:hypothetical protein
MLSAVAGITVLSGWAAASNSFRKARYARVLQALISGAVSGVDAVSPILYWISGFRVDDRGILSQLVAPFVWCIFFAGAIAAAVIYCRVFRDRRS